MRKTLLDDTHTFEEFGFRHSFGTQLAKIGEVKPKQTTIPGMKGSWSFGDEIGNKRITFTLFLMETNDRQKEILLDRLLDFLSDEEGYPRVVKFSLRREPDRHFFAKLDEVGEPETTDATVTIQISFTLTDPHRYSNVKADEVRWGSNSIDFQSQYKLGNTGSGAVERPITGNTTIYPDLEGKAAFPIIHIDGSGTNVLIKSKDRTINVGTFVNTDITIDSEMYVAYINGQEKIIDMDKFLLFPGVPVHITGQGLNFKLSLEYHNVYS